MIRIDLRKLKEIRTKEGESPVLSQKKKVEREKTCLKIGEPSSKRKYVILSDSEEYREGKLKRK